MLDRFFGSVGRFVIRWLRYIGEVVMLLAETIKQLKQPPRMRHVFWQMAHLGADSLPIVGLTLLFTGMVMTLQIAHEFIRFGAQSTIGGVITIAIGRELGPVLVGVVFALGWTPCVGTFLASALSVAATSGSVVRGITLLLAYSAGLGLPFVLCAVLMDQLSGALAWLREHARQVEVASGVFLVLIGILMATGTLGAWLRVLAV